MAGVSSTPLWLSSCAILPGYRPPPPWVIQDVRGQLVSLNRRRWLAAREAGVETLRCFYTDDDWRLKPCYAGLVPVCEVYRQGGDCCSCEIRKETL